MLPLRGVRVVDLTWAGAGPYASLQLGWLGAEVIKVEWPARPDVSRAGFYRRRASAVSPQFNDLNLNKLSLAADLAASDGAALLRRLVSVSDVLTASYRPGVLERLGFDYESLCRVRPDIIVATVSSAGQTGPESRYAGFASIFSVQGGLGTLTGYPDSAPAALGDSVDLRVGAALVFGVLAALYERRKTGRGRLVDVSAREVVSNALGAQVADFSMNGHVTERSANRLDDALVHELYRCAGDDAWVSIAVFEDADFAALCGAIGRADLLGSPPGAEIDAAISAWTADESAGGGRAAAAGGRRRCDALPLGASRRRRSPPGCQGRLRRHTAGGLGRAGRDAPAVALRRCAALPPLAPAAPLGHHNDFIIDELLGGAAEREEEPQS